MVTDYMFLAARTNRYY